MVDTRQGNLKGNLVELSPPRYGYRFRCGKMRRLRAAAWMDQAELAKRADLAVGTISRVENGYHTPHRNNVKKIADALGVDRNDLVEFQG